MSKQTVGDEAYVPPADLSVGGGLIDRPLAIVSLECKLPGADNAHEFWDLLAHGRSAVGKLPESVVRTDRFLDETKKRRGTTYSNVGAIVTRDPIDAQYLGLSAQEAANWDECHLRFAQIAKAAWEAFNARNSNHDIRHRCGVYIGHSGGANDAGELVYATMASGTAGYLEDCEYFKQLPDASQASIRDLFTQQMQRGRPVRREGGAPYLDANAIARLVAEITRVVGPQIVIEAACASSLVALGLAGVALNAGQIDAAIVGGASFNKVDSLILFSQAQSCSATDSRPFDDKADGLISSEGFVAIVVKRLDDAIRDGDKIEAVISGIGLASDGRGKSLWAPRREGQIESMRRAYSDEAQLQRVQYIEAHATSTQVGDATETAALAEFYRPKLQGRRLPIGSVKSNIGHTLETAGLAGLLKTVLSMKHEQFAPSINLKELNSTVDWSQVPFDIVTKTQPWPKPTGVFPRTAGVNAFGIGGLNVHIVVEQYSPDYHRATQVDNAPRVHVVKDEPIAIVGMGCVLPGALHGSELSSLLQSNSLLTRSPLDTRWESSLPRTYHLESGQEVAFKAGFIDNFEFDWRANRIPPKQVQHANPLQFMLLQAAGEALAAAGILAEPAALQRAAVVVGTVFGGEFGHGLQIGLRLQNAREELRVVLKQHGLPSTEIQDCLDEFERSLLKHLPALLDETGSFTSSTLASRITKHYNLMGGAFAIDAAGQSSGHALNIASQILRSGAVDTFVCAAGTRSLDYYSILRAHSSNSLPGQSRSFDEAWPAEGVVALTLQRESTARQRRSNILGFIDQIDFEFSGTTVWSNESTPASKHLHDLEKRIGRIVSAELLVGLAADIARDVAESRQLVNICDHHNSSKVVYSIGSSRPSKKSSSIYTPMSPSVSAKSNNSMSNDCHKANQQLADFASVSFHTVGCFPGQGSQSPELLNSPLMKKSAAKAMISRCDNVLRTLGSPEYHQLLMQLDAATDDSIWPIQASMMISDLAIAVTLQSQGVEFNAVIGHSLGELAAMVVAGCWSVEDAIQFVYHRAGAVAACARQVPSGLISIAASRSDVARLLTRSLSTLEITHCNAPTQTIVGGKLSDLEALQDCCQSERIACMRLAVPAAFHSTILSQARWQLMESANQVRLSPPRVPFYSTVSGSFVADPEHLRRNLVDQLVTPIDYSRDIKRIASFAPERFLEVGPGDVLTKLNRANLPKGTFAIQTAAETIPLDSSPTNGDTNSSTPLTAGPEEIKPAPRSIERTRLIDATSARRTAMRNRSLTPQDVARTERATPAQTSAKINGSLFATMGANGKSSVSSAQREAALPAIKPTEVPPSAPLPSREELLQFIVDFIVEHTGYPVSMIEPHWDLEADLGVDSIKKVQLFGELRQTFDLDTTRFRHITVRSINDICDAILSSPSQEPSDVASEVVAAISSFPTMSKELMNPSAGKPIAPAIVVPVADTRILAQPSITPATIAVSQSELDPEVLGEFMIDFVVEHTGYPRNMVELDAELESDLGLDSIKLAQMIGELRSSFNLNLTMEDRKAFINCRTLQDILDHLINRSEADDAQTSEVAETLLVAHDEKKKLLSTSTPSSTAKLGATAAVHALKATTELAAEDIAVATPAPTRQTSAFHTKRDELRKLIANASSYATQSRIQQTQRVVETAPQLDQSPRPTARRKAQIAPQTSGITQRYILRTEYKPPQESIEPPRFYGRALIVGENEIADALARRLHIQGVDVLRFAANDAEHWAEIFEQASKEGSIPHLFITTPHDENAQTKASAAWWKDRRREGFDPVFWLCQKWLMHVVDLGLMHDCSLVALPNLGGDFGFQNTPTAVEGGAIAGLVKAMIIECWMAGHRRLAFKLIDLAEIDAEASVDAMLTELAYGSYDTEVCYNAAGRHVVRAVPCGVSGETLRRPRSGDRWICTGGARGITAYVSENLAKRYDLELHLIGTTAQLDIPNEWRTLDAEGLRALKIQVMQHARDNAELFQGKNPLKVWQDVEKTLEIDETLARMRQQGIKVHYHAGDVSDPQSMHAIVNTISRDFGPIHGVLHGAGVGQDARFERKIPAKVDQCYSAKLDGAFTLIEATAEQPLTHWIAFGSISGRFGANGHTDYSGANDGLAKITDWLRAARPDVHAMAFHWHAWGDIGMATKPETKLALESIGMQFMPAAEGLRHLIAELESSDIDSEVLITDDRYHRAFYPAETLEAEGNVAKTSHQHALIDIDQTHTTVSDDKLQQIVPATLHPTRDPFLIEHRLNDRPLLPVVAEIELIVEAAMQHQSERMAPTGKRASSITQSTFPLHLSDIKVHAPFKCFSDEPHNVRIETSSIEKSPSISACLRGDALNRAGAIVGKDKALCDCQVEFGVRMPKALAMPKFADRNASWYRQAITEPTDKFYSGAPFRLIQRFAIEESRLQAELVAPSLIELAGLYRNATGWRVPSAIIDAGLYASGILAYLTVTEAVCLPMGFDHLYINDLPRPGQRLIANVHGLGGSDQHAYFDFDIRALDGTLYLAARRYQTAFVY